MRMRLQVVCSAMLGLWPVCWSDWEVLVAVLGTGEHWRLRGSPFARLEAAAVQSDSTAAGNTCRTASLLLQACGCAALCPLLRPLVSVVLWAILPDKRCCSFRGTWSLRLWA